MNSSKLEETITELSGQVQTLDTQLKKQSLRLSVLLEKLEESKNESKHLTTLLEEMLYSFHTPITDEAGHVSDNIVLIQDDKELVKLH